LKPRHKLVAFDAGEVQHIGQIFDASFLFDDVIQIVSTLLRAPSKEAKEGGGEV
jgi:hypothetical protein